VRSIFSVSFVIVAPTAGAVIARETASMAPSALGMAMADIVARLRHTEPAAESLFDADVVLLAPLEETLIAGGLVLAESKRGGSYALYRAQDVPGRIIVRRTKSQGLVFALLILAISATVRLSAESPHPHHTVKNDKHKHSIRHKAGWMGAGLAAGHFAGPAGSAGVGVAKYRRDLKASGHRRNRALVKIGVPIAVGVAAGPAGSAGYAAYQHRRWIKHHIFHSHSHHGHTRH
jgi:hypothetical protein